jgi:ComF family protein
MLRAILSAGLDLLLPRVCAGCESSLGEHETGVVCGRCWARLPVLPHPQCRRCGHPRRPRGDCAGCALLPPYVRSARSLCWVPAPTSSALLAALKYHGWPRAAEGIGERLARLRFPADVEAERAALVPVPLARSKERARGYNQAERLAASVGAHWQVPVWRDVLTRERAGPSQTALTRGERLANVHRAYNCAAGAAALVAGQHLILVDDVLTTGATLNACAEALFEAGARTLSYLTFGRARTAADRR